ncbi:hypothetical protein FHS27_001609 [Rhodopirellula rubra]|uniref:Uncharacterized protein n=1 Tax=Aporhodopirellula rubra TaxID=980271 RepID=A0A7W5DWN1_9BACT|nr:hypothetical protein [Aporhodopirellula rubra]MBB3205805.1 hypothetical protein [Aporhodopirellula rubra]
MQPPDFLVARVEASGPNFYAQNVARPGTIAPAETTRNDSSAPQSCCCCQQSNCDVPEPDAVAASDSKEQTKAENDGPLRLVMLEDAARCRGIQLFWSIFSEAVIDPPTVAIASTPPSFLFLLAIEDDRALSRTLCPDPPVP